jgi:hypothetical protein
MTRNKAKQQAVKAIANILDAARKLTEAEQAMLVALHSTQRKRSGVREKKGRCHA